MSWFILIRFCTSLLVICSNICAMPIVEHYTWKRHAAECPHETERAIYGALRRKPLETSHTCFIVPWDTLINRRETDCVRDIQIKGGAFTVCGHEIYTRVIPVLEEIGVTHLCVTQPERKRYSSVTLIPILYVSKNGTNPAQKKDILYSFIGFCSGGNIRGKIFALPKHKDVVIKRRKTWYFWNKNPRVLKAELREYKNVIARSRFGLCPRGFSPNTIRLPELLQAGAIPVIIADNIVLPIGVDWDKCVLRVKESDVGKIDQIIRSIPLEQEVEMRAACLNVARLLAEDPAYFIRYYFDSRREDAC